MSPDRFRIIGFVCDRGAYAAADLAGEKGLHYSSDVTLIKLPCAGRLDVLQVLHAFREGADGVFAVGCLEKNCHYQYGNFEAKKRIDEVRKILDALGLGGERVEMFHVASNQGWRFQEIADTMVSRLQRLGRNPLGGRA